MWRNARERWTSLGGSASFQLIGMCWRWQSCPDMHKSANPEPPGWTWRKHIMCYGCMGQPKPFYRPMCLNFSFAKHLLGCQWESFLKAPPAGFHFDLGLRPRVCLHDLLYYTVMALYLTPAIPIKMFPRGQGPHFVAINHGGNLQNGWVLVKICSDKMRRADTWVYIIPFV